MGEYLTLVVLVAVGVVAVVGAFAAPLAVLLAARTWSAPDPARFAFDFWLAAMASSVLAWFAMTPGSVISGYLALAALEFEVHEAGAAPTVEDHLVSLLSLAVALSVFASAALAFPQVAAAAWRRASRHRREAGLAALTGESLMVRVAVVMLWSPFVAAAVMGFVASEWFLVVLGLDAGVHGMAERNVVMQPSMRIGLCFLVPAVVVPVLHVIAGAVQAIGRRRRLRAACEVRPVMHAAGSAQVGGPC